jgi:asparagine synthase (glutamine-hydrolysing)
MCGFVALIGLRGQTPPLEALNKAKQAIAHRGPDGEGTCAFENVALGFRRLAILDLHETGAQPMVSTDGNLVIVFNGAIFNYVELRAELHALGYSFRSTGDTEVLLTAYRHWGKECLSRLNGMWAFVILDKVKREIFGARDRFGEKPLYVSRTSQWLLFASEIKALRESRLVDLHVNWPIVSEWALEQSLDHTDETFYKEVTRIPAGSAFTVSLDADAVEPFRQFKYWSIDNNIAVPGANPVEEFAELLEDAVRIRTRSDVPVGVMLSGGIDSTSLACAIHRTQRSAVSPLTQGINAFCFRDAVFNEDEYIRATTEQCNLTVHTLDTTPQKLWSALPEHLAHHDEPVHSVASLIGYELMRMAKQQGMVVMLGGQGADETLAGYYYSYYKELWQGWLNRGKLIDLTASMLAYRKVHGLSLVAESVGLLKSFVKLRTTGVYDYQGHTQKSRVRHLQADTWFAGPVRAGIRPMSYAIPGNGLRAKLRSSVEVAELPLYLRVEDRNAMAHSIEARQPFMDYRLVSFADKLDDSFKLRSPWNKWILREAMKNRIPESVRARPGKFGFSNSSGSWFDGPLREPMQTLLEEERSQLREIVNVPVVTAAVGQCGNHTAKMALKFLTVAQLALWLANCRKTGVSL